MDVQDGCPVWMSSMLRMDCMVHMDVQHGLVWMSGVDVQSGCVQDVQQSSKLTPESTEPLILACEKHINDITNANYSNAGEQP